MHKLSRVALIASLAVWAQSASAADLIVSAAASLTNAFKTVGSAFEAQNPGDKVVFNFAASDVLMQQIAQGAPADVFASADQSAMDKAVQAKVVNAATRVDFAKNAIVMIVPSDSKLELESVKDLSKDGVKRITYGDPASVPAGRYTRDALQATGVWDAVSAKGVPANNVRQALDYVARGEVEAGFVFATDAAVMQDKVKVATQVPTTTPVTYPIAVTATTKNAAEAQRFIDYVRSPAGQAVLAKYGFQKP